MSSNGSFQQEILAFQAHTMCLGNQLTNNALSISDIGDYIPGSVMVQNLGTMVNSYMNKFGCDILRKSTEELKLMGPEFFDRYFPPEEFQFFKKELLLFVIVGDPNKLHSFIQRVRPDSNAEYKWYFTTARIIPSSDDNTTASLINISVPINMLNSTGSRMRNLIENDDYMRKNFDRFCQLSMREKEIIKMIVEGKSSHDIAVALFRSIHTVNTHRKNIIHKLGVNSLAELIKFAVAFNVV
jgi:LuxR family transcriptional regulator